MRTASWRRRALDHLYGSIAVEGGNEDLTAEIREPGRYAVDQPLITSGRWLGPGDGLVLEAASRRRGVEAGDTVTIQGRPFPVLGAATTVGGRFPLYRPAQVWVTPETAERMRELGMTEEGFELSLRLRDPSDAQGFVTQHGPDFRSDPDSSAIAFLGTWRNGARNALGHRHRRGHAVRRRDADRDPHDRDGRGAGRGADGPRIRQVGTLKAVGVRPGRSSSRCCSSTGPSPSPRRCSASASDCCSRRSSRTPRSRSSGPQPRSRGRRWRSWAGSRCWWS